MGTAPHHHFGVYARIRTAGHILLVHKTRGPYTGLLDLPGGRPEPGESWSQTLERELHEELGIALTATGRFEHFTVHVQQSSTGEPINFRHRGVYLDLQLPAPPTTTTSPDTAGHEWFNLHIGDQTRLTAAARAVLAPLGTPPGV